MRSIAKRVKNDNLDDKKFVKNNHKSYKKDKRIVNKKLRRTPIVKLAEQYGKEEI